MPIIRASIALTGPRIVRRFISPLLSDILCAAAAYCFTMFTKGFVIYSMAGSRVAKALRKVRINVKLSCGIGDLSIQNEIKVT